jgi:hypothetical protein
MKRQLWAALGVTGAGLAANCQLAARLLYREATWGPIAASARAQPGSSARPHSTFGTLSTNTGTSPLSGRVHTASLRGRWSHR